MGLKLQNASVKQIYLTLGKTKHVQIVPLGAKMNNAFWLFKHLFCNLFTKNVSDVKPF